MLHEWDVYLNNDKDVEHGINIDSRNTGNFVSYPCTKSVWITFKKFVLHLILDAEKQLNDTLLNYILLFIEECLVTREQIFGTKGYDIGVSGTKKALINLENCDGQIFENQNVDNYVTPVLKTVFLRN